MCENKVKKVFLWKEKPFENIIDPWRNLNLLNVQTYSHVSPKGAGYINMSDNAVM